MNKPDIYGTHFDAFKLSLQCICLFIIFLRICKIIFEREKNYFRNITRFSKTNYLKMFIKFYYLKFFNKYGSHKNPYAVVIFATIVYPNTEMQIFKGKNFFSKRLKTELFYLVPRSL